MKKFLILTSITNGKDKLIDPKENYENCDFIAYVDKKQDGCEIWEQREIFNFSNIDGFSNRRNAKPYKILSAIMFPQYEYVIWEDGNHQIKKNPQEIINEYGENVDVLVFKHPDRKCTYEEMKACVQWKLDDSLNIQNQFSFYRNNNMPEFFGLYEMSTFIMKTSHVVKELQLMWWEQITKFSSRDQISFPYCLWKMGNKITKKKLRGYSNLFSMDGKNTGNDYFDDQGKHLKY